jgi:hypothetical protein
MQQTQEGRWEKIDGKITKVKTLCNHICMNEKFNSESHHLHICQKLHPISPAYPT